MSMDKQGNDKTPTIDDLPVTDEQADRATGGSSANQGQLIVGVDDVRLRWR